MKKVLLAVLCSVSVSWLMAQCPGQVQIDVNITPDNYPQETTWEIRTPPPASVLVASGTTNDTSFCYAAGSCLVFTIFDSASDGLCCGYGLGSYSVSVNSVVQASGGQFGASQTTWINCAPGLACTNPIPITALGTYTAPQADTWYIFQPDSMGNYTISTCGLNSCDTKIWVYDHCQGLTWNTTNIGTIYYDDDGGGCGYQAVVHAVLDTALTYYIRIGQYNTSCGANPIGWSLTYQGQVHGCMDPAACNYNPLATVDDGSCIYAPNPNCPGPDLEVVEATVQNSLQLDNINAANCQVQEGCLTGYGLRDILRFTTHIKNIGNADYYIGTPSANNPQFTFDACHGHWHYVGYAAYLLYDMQGNEIPIGFKNGFCVLDLECSGGGTAQYGCGNMGISHGCGDIYSSGLDCQWIDITDVDTGTYQLVVKVNWDNDPDALGRFEQDYTNNWASVCVHLTRDALGNPNFTLVPNCPEFTDCLGVPYGNAEVDCDGICNGPSVRGDMNADTNLTQPDAVLYVNALIANTISPSTCKDMDGDGEVTVFDAALINNCTENGSTAVNDPCDFPFGVVNINDTTELRISNVNFNQQYVDIAITNPLNKVVAYQFTMHGIQIQSVQNLVSPLEYNITPDFSVVDQEVIGISYQQMLVDKNTSPDALCRVYYSFLTDTVICIDHITDIVNQHYEATVPLVGGNCVMVPSVFSVGEEGSTISAHIFPNPAQDIIHINLGLSETNDVVMEIMDELGRKVMTQIFADVYVKTVDVDLSNLSNGVYIVSLQTGKGKITQRVVLSR